MRDEEGRKIENEEFLNDKTEDDAAEQLKHETTMLSYSDSISRTSIVHELEEEESEDENKDRQSGSEASAKRAIPA